LKGLDIVLSSYFEEMRLAVIRYNALLRDIKVAEIADNKAVLDSRKLIDIFNEKEMLNLNIQFRYIIQPAFESINLSLANYIKDSMQSFNTIYITIFSIFITLLFIFYLVIWRPFENNLNQTV
jgi:hypothetical protein